MRIYMTDCPSRGQSFSFQQTNLDRGLNEICRLRRMSLVSRFCAILASNEENYILPTHSGLSAYRSLTVAIRIDESKVSVTKPTSKSPLCGRLTTGDQTMWQVGVPVVVTVKVAGIDFPIGVIPNL